MILLFLISCVNEPCFDVVDLDKKTEDIIEWFVDETIQNKTIVDTNGISETLETFDYFRTPQYSENSNEDDCGNSYGSWSSTIQYTTSLSRIHFSIDIRGQILDGFYLRLNITNINNHKSTTYDFVSKKSRENNATITYIDSVTVSSKEYLGVLEINFNEKTSINDVETVYYAKKYGIIKFKLKNGNIFEVV
jgi:hypothetical protein